MVADSDPTVLDNGGERLVVCHVRRGSRIAAKHGADDGLSCDDSNTSCILNACCHVCGSILREGITDVLRRRNAIDEGESRLKLKGKTGRDKESQAI